MWWELQRPPLPQRQPQKRKYASIVSCRPRHSNYRRFESFLSGLHKREAPLGGGQAGLATRARIEFTGEARVPSLICQTSQGPIGSSHYDRRQLPRAGNGFRNAILTSVAEVTQRRLQASNDPAAPGLNVPAGFLDVIRTSLCDSREVRQFGLARLRKLAHVLLDASADTTLAWLNLSAFRFDIDRATQGGRLFFCHGA